MRHELAAVAPNDGRPCERLSERDRLPVRLLRRSLAMDRIRVHLRRPASFLSRSSAHRHQSSSSFIGIRRRRRPTGFKLNRRRIQGDVSVNQILARFVEIPSRQERAPSEDRRRVELKQRRARIKAPSPPIKRFHFFRFSLLHNIDNLICR